MCRNIKSLLPFPVYPIAICVIQSDEIFLLLFLYSSVWIIICFKTVTRRSARLWPGRFQLAHVAFLETCLDMWPLWSDILFFSWRPVVPMYRCWPFSFWHSRRYIMFYDLRVMFLVILHVLSLSILTFLPYFTYAQVGQVLPQLATHTRSLLI